MNSNTRPEHVSEADWFSPKTNPNFWDCECDGEPEMYIKHKATQLTCDLCGAQEDEMPDSHQREVDELSLFNNEEGYPLTRAELIDRGISFSVQDESGRSILCTPTLEIWWEREPLPNEREDFEYFMVTDPAQPEWAKGQIVPLANPDYYDWNEE
jgi:hypothetical protein